MTKLKPWGAVRNWAALQKVAHDGFKDGVAVLEAIETMERGNRVPVVNAIAKAGADDAHYTLRIGLLYQLIIMITRAYADVARNDDLHLRAAMEFLRKSDLAALTKDAKCQEHLRDAIDLFDVAAANPELKLIEHMRNKQVAHWAVYKPKGEPKYMHLFNMGRVTATIWEQLAWGSEIVTLRMDSQLIKVRRSADAFWSKWEA